jgi:hypothetical protein
VYENIVRERWKVEAVAEPQPAPRGIRLLHVWVYRTAAPGRFVSEIHSHLQVRKGNTVNWDILAIGNSVGSRATSMMF